MQSIPGSPSPFMKAVFSHTGLLQNPGSIHIPILFLSLLFATHFGKKQGDFGILTSCSLRDGRLRFDCSYPPCDDSTPFQCDFTNENGDLLGSSTQLVFRSDTFFEDKNRLCQLYVSINWTALVKPTNYTCTLTRRKRREVKNVTLEYKEGKDEAATLALDCKQHNTGILNGERSGLE
ncbi:hypothetical protein AOLI_G00293300 [Acnodon oligacanthus]